MLCIPIAFLPRVNYMIICVETFSQFLYLFLGVIVLISLLRFLSEIVGVLGSWLGHLFQDLVIQE